MAKADGSFGNYQKAEMTYLKSEGVAFKIAPLIAIRELQGAIRENH